MIDPSELPVFPSKVKRPINAVDNYDTELAALKAEENILINFQNMLQQRKRMLLTEMEKLQQIMKEKYQQNIKDEPVGVPADNIPPQ